MKINGKLAFDASSASEIQNLRIEKVGSLPTHLGAADQGRAIYDSAANVLYIGNATTWVAIATGGNAASLQTEVDNIETTLGTFINADGTSNFGTLTGPLAGSTSFSEALTNLANAISGKDTLAELDDVDVTGVVDNSLLQFDSASGKWIDAAIGSDSGVMGYDVGLANLASNSTTGVLVQTGADTYATRSIVGPAEGIVVTNGDGVAGNPTISLANDLAALEGLSTTGYVVRTGDGTATTRSIAGTSNNIVVTNGGGVASDTSIDLAPVTQGTTGTLSKVTIDGFGRVTGNAAVTTADLTPLLDATYVNAAGDSMTGSLAMGGNSITGLAAPTAPTDAANKAYVDNAVAGLTWEAPVVDMVADTAARDALTGLAAGDRVYVAADHTIYTFDGTAWAATDVLADGGAFFNSTTDSGYVFTGTQTVQFAGGGMPVAGTGLNQVGNVFSVKLGAGIAELPAGEVGVDLFSSTGAIRLTTDGTAASTDTAAKLALVLAPTGGLNQADGLGISTGGVTNAMLANNAVNLNADAGTGSVELGQTLAVNGDSVQGIATSVTGQTVTVTAVDASSTQKGVSSFSSDFTVTAGAVALADEVKSINWLSDVDTDTIPPAAGELLSFDGTNWVPRDPSTVGATELDGLSDVMITPEVERGQTLVRTTDGQFINQKIYHLETVGTAATTWTVNHDIGQRFCNVTIVDDTDQVIIPESITFNSSTSLTVTFNTPVAGRCVVMGVSLTTKAVPI